jgi:hypothetical protein
VSIPVVDRGAARTPRRFPAQRREISQGSPKASDLLFMGPVAEHPAPVKHSTRGPARRYLTVALIVWFGGAAIGIATLPRREGRPAGTARPPAHRPGDIEPPSAHDLPNVA